MKLINLLGGRNTVQNLFFFFKLALVYVQRSVCNQFQSFPIILKNSSKKKSTYKEKITSNVFLKDLCVLIQRFTSELMKTYQPAEAGVNFTLQLP